ncbi:MAG: Ribbon-helix-helix protein, copG family [uncultured Thiotrichaceae bacterium]|uniref:Ribbon-helix-helix protein, copG family n=1 Tax=uncultured Thiotrichaceae bacterium TaxID=298394 RepID=A0A6S6TUI5_9GAMM|nr:MAG: Ribbon-helix-helix protein, copG family [uncultured Thiotrichaceae bacterium]
MTISIRLDTDTEKHLREYLRTQNGSMSEFVRSAINEKLAHYEANLHKPYEIGKELFGAHSSGRDDLSTNRKALLKEKLHAKHHR